MAKKQAKSRRRSSSSDELVGGVYHGGKLYDPDKPGDQKKFADLVASGAVSKEALQRWSDSGAVVGFGTKAPIPSKEDEEAQE